MGDTMRRPVDVTPWLRPERELFVDLLAGLDDEAWATPTECPEWTVKGIALHVLGDDLSLLSRQRDDAVPGLVLFAEHHAGFDFRQLLDGFNEQWVTAASFMGRRLLLDLLRTAGEWTADFYENVHPERTGEPVGFFGPMTTSPYWQISAREYVERWAHHQQVRRAVGAPDLGAEFLAPATEVIITAIAGHLVDLAAPAGSRVGFRVPDVADWTLTRSAEGWDVEPGGGGSRDVVVTFDRATAPAVLSRAIPADRLRDAISILGDEVLADEVVASIAPFVGSPA